MAKLLLVHPAGSFEEAEIKSNPSYPPLGLAYIASYLRERGHNVKILDILGEGYDIAEKSGNSFRVGLPLNLLKNKFRGFVPDIVGITNPYTKNSLEAHRTAEALRNLFPRSLIVMGGAHCSVLPQEVLKDKNIDAACIGEGEVTMEEIALCCDRYNSKRDRMSHIEGIHGLAFIKDGELYLTPKRKLIKNPDDIPFPARDLLPMRNYSQGHHENPFFLRAPSTSLITSRGCPNNCMYCSVKSVWGRTWRGRNPQAIVAEIKHLTETYEIRELSICDDSMSCDKDRLKDICREILKNRIDIKWCTPNGIAIWLLDKECIDLMKKSGCYRLTFGLETGDRETLALIRKRYDRKKAIELIKYANRKGFWTIGTFIIGFPWEKRPALYNTLRYAIESEVDLAVFYSAYPFPGTDLNKYYHEEGLSVPPNGSVTQGGVDTKYMTSNEISNLRNVFIKQVTKNRLFHAYRVLYKLRSIEDLKFTMRIAKRAINIIIKPLKTSKSTSGMLRD